LTLAGTNAVGDLAQGTTRTRAVLFWWVGGWVWRVEGRKSEDELEEEKEEEDHNELSIFRPTRILLFNACVSVENADASLCYMIL